MQQTGRAPKDDLGQKRISLAPTDNRRTLRLRTAQMHAMSEDHWQGVFGKPHGLRHFLAAMKMLHRDFGLPAARNSGMAGAVEMEHQRMAALCRDLQHPVPTACPTDMTADTAWGVLYALNGSALGAAALMRPGGALTGQASDYLEQMRGYAQSGELGRFIRLLNAQTLDMRCASAGADAVFAAMSRHEM